jgi:ribosomal protein L11 methylase PrmA
MGLLGVLDSLETLVRQLRWDPKNTEWADYYADTNYSAESLREKENLVASFLDSLETKPSSVWDIGANDGRFSMIAALRGIPTVAWDLDPAAVEKCHDRAKSTAGVELLALVQDLANPSPALGWAHRERQSMAARGPADTLFALALIHHLAIGNNVPLPDIASFFAEIGKTLVVEFVPKSDSQVRRMLATREDVFSGYSQDGFEHAFGSRFELLRREQISGTERVLYLMKRRGEP